MKQLQLSSRALHAFLTLATCRNFTVAAERCHMSQSAFSQLVGRLEEEIGARLFDRTSRGIADERGQDISTGRQKHDRRTRQRWYLPLSQEWD